MNILLTAVMLVVELAGAGETTMNEQEKADFLKERRSKNIVLVVVQYRLLVKNQFQNKLQQ